MRLFLPREVVCPRIWVHLRTTPTLFPLLETNSHLRLCVSFPRYLTSRTLACEGTPYDVNVICHNEQPQSSWPEQYHVHGRFSPGTLCHSWSIRGCLTSTVACASRPWVWCQSSFRPFYPLRKETLPVRCGHETDHLG